MRRPVLLRSEAGVTLVELLTVIAILGIIVVPLTNATIVGLRTSDKTAKVLVASADRQMLTNYLAPDALSATSSDPAATACVGPAGSRVLLLTWSEATQLAPVRVITSYASDYRLVTIAGRQRLVRDYCVAGGAAQEVTVAHDAAAASPTVAAGKVAITVTDSLGAQYTVSGTRRAA